MKRVLAHIMLISLLVSMLASSLSTRNVMASGTVYIRAGGSIDPPTAPISTLDNVTYTFTDSIFDEIVVERDNIVVDGEGYTVQGTGSGKGLSLSGRSNVTIKSMTIKAFNYGIWLYSSSYSSVSGNNITNNGYGIVLDSSSYSSVSGNSITANTYGIVLDSSSYSSVSGNSITANNQYGIRFYSSFNSSVSGNNITDNGAGVWLGYSSSNRFYHNNLIDNTQQVYFYATGFANVWDDGYPNGGNYWSNYTDTDLYGGLNQDESGSDGIWDHPYSIYGDDQDNYPFVKPWIPFENQTIYVRVDGSVDPSGAPIQRKGDTYTFTANIASNSHGIVVERDNAIIDGAGYTLQGLGATDSKGIDLAGRNNVTVRNVGIMVFDLGVFLSSSANHSIIDNNISNNNFGIALGSSSGNSVIRNNIAANTVFGILLVYSSDNEFYHNNITDNINQLISISSVNFWDDGYPSGGNYWSDYSGADADGDGIGDTPYVIDTSNSDNFPLMQPWASPDIAVTDASSAKTVAGQGFNLSIYVTIANLGNKIESFNLTVSTDSTELAMQHLTLKGGNSTVFTFEWNTSSFAYGNYSLAAAAAALQGEILIENNNFTGGWVFVTIPGDINGDQWVNGKDGIILGKAFYPTGIYNPNADINDDDFVNAKDAVILGAHFGQHW